MRLDIQLTQHVTTQMCLFHVNVTQLQRSIVSRYYLGHGFRNQKLDCFKRWSGCEEVHALLLCVVAFLQLFRHQTATNFWRPLVPFVCVDLARLDYFVRTNFSNWDTAVHLHLEVSSQLFNTCLPDNLRIQKATIDVVDVGLFDTLTFVQRLTIDPRSLSRVLR